MGSWPQRTFSGEYYQIILRRDEHFKYRMTITSSEESARNEAIRDMEKNGWQLHAVQLLTDEEDHFAKVHTQIVPGIYHVILNHKDTGEMIQRMVKAESFKHAREVAQAKYGPDGYEVDPDAGVVMTEELPYGTRVVTQLSLF